MPGHNHYSSCICGWCTGGGGGSFSASIPTPRVSSTPQTDEALTCKTPCRWCGAEVYYHTNGYGDSVLFDSLGSPWEVHDCWNQHREQKKSVRLFDLKVDQFKCLVLTGAIRILQTEEHIPTEKSVAIEMGISIEDLQEHYKSLYVVIPRAGGRIMLAQGF